MTRIIASLLGLLPARVADSGARLVAQLFPPAVLGLVMLLLGATSFFERLENITMDLRFRARASHDPPADARLILVGIDEPSLERFGRWPWPRERHGDFCKLLGVNDPAVVGFDILFTEPGQAEDDAYFGESVRTVPRLVTGALTDNDAESVPAGSNRTKPIASVHGDRSALPGKKSARVPIPALSAASWYGFVDSDPSGSDGVRRRLPLIVRVGEEVYPSLALQLLLLSWNVAPDKVDVQLGRWIAIPGPDGLRKIPITAAGEVWLNYRAKESFLYWSYQGLFEALYLDATGEKPFPANAPTVTGKIVVVGQVASGLTDLGPSPLESTSPLVLTSLNALNSMLKGDFLRVVPIWPWPALFWMGAAWATLVGRRNQPVVHRLLWPVATVVLYAGGAIALFMLKSVALPLAVPVLGFFLVQVGTLVFDWIDKVISERRMSAELARTTEAKKLLEQELGIAREIQMSTLPQVFPAFPDRLEIDLHAVMIPAKFVGGDLYEFFFVDPNKLFFVIGDVSGKGVPAALFMTMALAVIRAHVIAGRSPAETLRRSNNVLALRNERCTFVTIFCGILDTETGHVCYANGGHNPPVLLDGEGGVSFLAEEGTAIGAIEGLDFDERELTLKPDQGLFLYTDGVTEAIDVKEQLFSEERLLSALSLRHSAFTAERLTAKVQKELAEFVGDAAQFDDITTLTVFYRGKSGGPAERVDIG